MFELKRIDPGQSAQSAQTDLDRYVLLLVSFLHNHERLFTRDSVGLLTKWILWTHNDKMTCLE